MQIPLRHDASAPIQTWITCCRCHSFGKVLMYRYASTVSSSAAEVHPPETSVWWTTGFFLMVVVVLLVWVFFKLCGETIIERNTTSGCPQWKKHGKFLLLCLHALWWIVIKMLLLCSAFQWHALTLFIKAVLLDMFYWKGNCDTARCSDWSNVTLPSALRLALFGCLAPVRAALLLPCHLPLGR